MILAPVAWAISLVIEPPLPMTRLTQCIGHANWTHWFLLLASATPAGSELRAPARMSSPGVWAAAAAGAAPAKPAAAPPPQPLKSPRACWPAFPKPPLPLPLLSLPPLLPLPPLSPLPFAPPPFAASPVPPLQPLPPLKPLPQSLPPQSSHGPQPPQQSIGGPHQPSGPYCSTACVAAWPAAMFRECAFSMLDANMMNFPLTFLTKSVGSLPSVAIGGGLKFLTTSSWIAGCSLISLFKASSFSDHLAQNCITCSSDMLSGVAWSNCWGDARR
mmetsp:Transcript_96254/g.294410  ORF Transcript_96254/g.294410 Transcript_96254/m.294410 type:complete len:273 (+) Transcript_96254:379-1197(+)